MELFDVSVKKARDESKVKKSTSVMNTKGKISLAPIVPRKGVPTKGKKTVGPVKISSRSSLPNIKSESNVKKGPGPPQQQEQPQQQEGVKLGGALMAMKWVSKARPVHRGNLLPPSM